MLKNLLYCKTEQKFKEKLFTYYLKHVTIILFYWHDFKKNKMHQTQNFLFSFFLLFLLTTFEFVISERPVKMSDQPKVCLDLNGHLGSSRHCPLTGHYFEPCGWNHGLPTPSRLLKIITLVIYRLNATSLIRLQSWGCRKAMPHLSNSSMYGGQWKSFIRM